MEVEEVFESGDCDITTAELWRFYDGRRLIVYKLPKHSVDVRDVCIAISHEWLHIAVFKCGERLPEPLAELLARVSVQEV